MNLAPAIDPLLELRDLRITIHGEEGPARVLDHVSIRIAPGTIMGLVGESGCGKSTTIKAILGILPRNARVEAGGIRFEGEDLLALSEQVLATRVRGKRISFIPQDPFLAFNPVFTVGTQLLEIMRWHGAGRSDRESADAARRRHRDRLLGLLRRVQIPDPETALERYPHQFSGGQRQRLLIAAALSCSPRLIIADEPTTALDVTTQNEILRLVRDLAGEMGVSMLFVTHDLGVVARICDEMTVMYAGQTVETGPTHAVINDPQHPYTRALVNCHPDRSTGFVGIPGSVPSPYDPPAGCRFQPRCERARPQCAERAARLQPVDGRRRVDCIEFDGPRAAAIAEQGP